jgi:NitT/TauT family transport system substrate-binding protein
VPVRLVLQWLPQSQFAGFYMALDQGFYREAGLDVTLIHAGPGPSSLDFLVDGRADFATLFLSDAIVHSGNSVPLVQVVQLMQRSNLMLVAWKDMGIEQPGDLDGKRISCWTGPFSGAFTAFFQQHGVHPVLRPQNHSVNLFLDRGVAVCAAMAYNEYHRIYQAGIDYEQLTVFMMRDYDLGFPEDGIYTTAEMAAQYPERCRALRQATLAGWEYARRHPEAAITAVLRESKLSSVPVNRAHSRWMLEHVLLSIFPPDDGGTPGCLDRRTYLRTADTLTSAGLTDHAPSFEAFAPFEAKEQP